jgi:adenylate cyclase
MARELLEMGEKADDEHIRLEGHCILALTLYYLERMEEGLEHFDQANALYDPEQHRAHLFEYGHEPGMVNSVYHSLALWWVGLPDSAARMAANGRAISEDADHPYSKGFAHTFSARLHQSRGEVDECIARAETAIELSIEHGFPLWLAYAGMMKGWALAQRGELDEALALFDRGLEAWTAMGALIWRPYYLALHADALIKAGALDQAAEALDEATEIAAQTHESLDLSYFERLRGEILWTRADGDPKLEDQARGHFREALRMAEASNAKAWQLEHATWLVRTAPEGAEAEAAKERLSEIYRSFTEGHDSPRLQEAAELLDG